MVSRLLRPPALGRLRLASVDDAPTIMELLTDSMARNFRIRNAADVVYLISKNISSENGVLTICQLDVNEALIGCLAARDYPQVPAVHPTAWEDFIWTKYKAVELNARNTLFIHLLCWNPLYSRDIVDDMLRSVFMHDPYVQHIAVMKSLLDYPLLVPGQSRSEASFRRLIAMEKGMSGDQLPALCIADRKEVCPRLKIRRAVEEDNDDIVPILEAHSTKLRELYGEFYISELISRHPESDRILLVAEHKELAVGVMCLNTLINYEALEENFELSPYIGLRKPDKAPYPAKRSKDQDSNVSFNLNACLNNNSNNAPEWNTQSSSDAMARLRDIKSRVTWILDEEDFDLDIPRNLSTIPMAQLDILELLDEDEEEIEFDIVNIDTDLLRVPELLSYDSIEKGIDQQISKILDGHMKKDFADDKKKILGALPAKIPEPTRYSGAPNAFLLELFAMSKDYDERHGFGMLEVAYELFPERDYCIVCLPSNQPSFPLLEHFTLVTAFSSRLKFINETLYVAHVNSVRGDMSVRPGEAYDLPGLYNIVEHAPRVQGLIDLFEKSLSSHTLDCFVMLSENQPVGMVVLGPLDEGTSIRIQYDLEPEPRRPGTDGMIVAGVVSPVMEPHHRWFTRELLRHTPYTTLFWTCRLFSKGDSSPNKNLMSLGGHMMPVHPRASVPNLSGDKSLEKIYKDLSHPFALWVLERPLTSLPKVYVNNSIVVVGASRTGLAFLESLFLGPTSQYLTFSNVTLISEHGLPAASECLRAADTCVPRDGRYCDRYLKSVPFYFYLDVMSAVVVKIDRKKKCIYLRSGGVKFYDELVLTCGHQFQHPDYLQEALALVKEVELGKPCDRMLMDNPKYKPDGVPPPPVTPDNLMLINSLYQANFCLRKLLRMITDARGEAVLSVNNPVIVYGDYIEAYSCMSALLELSLSPEMITFVEPFPPEDPAKLRVNCFNNETIDEKVQNKLEDLGIKVYRGYYLAGWHKVESRIDAVHLLSQLQAVSLSCFALFYYGLKAIDINSFRAINECGLVYDGGLVVSPTFETNDPSVFGAGTCVKYSRRLYANARAQRHYSSEDVGEALARIFLKKLDPFVMAQDSDGDELGTRYRSSLLAYKESQGSVCSVTQISSSLRKWQPVVKFESPIMQCATLPGPLYYLKIRKPGCEVPMAVQISLPHQGHTLMTDKRNNYFRLQLNVLHCVTSLTCLSHKPFHADLLVQLYGKHEAFFDKLLTRYQLGEIDDFFEFFTQPWLSALYQETFSQLIKDINEQDVVKVYDVMKSRFNIYDRDTKSVKSVSGPKSSVDNRYIGTFRSVLNRAVTRSSGPQVKDVEHKDIPSCSAIRDEASKTWRQVGGEGIVLSILGGYLNRHSVTNPHYAVPKAEFYASQQKKY